MGRFTRLIAVLAAALLLATPAAWACGELLAAMDCCDDMAPMHHADKPKCHVGGDEEMTCCAKAPASDPVEATAFPGDHRVALEISVSPVAESHRVAQPQAGGPAGPPRAQDLARYTLFSALLL